MRIKRIKNRLIRATVFCVLSSFFVIQMLHHRDLMGVAGVVMFSTAFFLIFRSEKMINLAHSKRYRFSFLRLVFNFESFIFSNIPESLKDFSVQISILIVVSLFSLFTFDLTYLLISGPLLFILTLLKK